jgi:co-chaperonin GroES (HSP10)
MSKNNGGRTPNLGLAAASNVPIIQPRPEAPARSLCDEAKPHPWDDLKPTKAWVLVEQVSTEEKTLGGVIIPEAAQMAHWMVLAVGPLVTDIKPGDFIMAGTPNGQVAVRVYEGRSFAMLWHGDEQPHSHIAAIMPPPDMSRAKVNEASRLVLDGAS